MGTDLLSLWLKRYEQDPFDIDKYLLSKLVAEQSTLFSARILIIKNRSKMGRGGLAFQVRDSLQ